jgi:hypothetical protein
VAPHPKTMSSLSPAHYDRVQKDLLHVSLRQVTEDPEPGQLANLARRAASFKKNRQDLDNHRFRKAAERIAADKRKDDALRLKLNSVAGMFCRPNTSSLILICPVDTRSRPQPEAAREDTSGFTRRLGVDESTTRGLRKPQEAKFFADKTNSPSTGSDKPDRPASRTR